MSGRRTVAALLIVVAVGCTAQLSEPIEPAAVSFRPTLAASATSVTSPDDGLRIDIGLDDGAPVYRVVRLDGETETVVLGSSPLGLETSLGSFGSELEVVDVGSVEAWSDSFDLPTGKARVASIDGRRRTVRFAPSTGGAVGIGVQLEVDLLATDLGVAHRSRLVAGATVEPSHVRLDWERTGFSVPPTSRVWLQNHDSGAIGRPAYEQRRSAARDVSTPIRSADGWTLPALFENDGTWTLIAEAGLSAGGAGSHLSGVTSGGRFTFELPDAFDGNGLGTSHPQGGLPFETPWRVVVTSRDVGDIVESNLVRHLSEPGPDLDWVEPGVASWSWWSDQDSPRDVEALREFVDLATDFGWPYSLIDANWTDIDDADFADLVRYAATQDVGLLLWYNSGGPHNAVTEAPRGLMTDRDIRRAEMARISELGIRGIKVDFFHSDKPQGIQLYLDILADAAEFELLVSFHGSTVPRGWSRTWPNLMTMEAVLGGEQYIFNQGFPALAPAQNTVLPFTRNAVGSMDFTPMSLGDATLRRTSNGHELALAVVFESGLQHFVDTPESFARQPDAVRTALSDVPVAWDETQFLAGTPDDFVAIARRRGTEWWIGVINGIDAARSIDLDVDALDIVGRSATVICDGDDKRSYSISEINVTSTITADVLDEGGCLIRIP